MSNFTYLISNDNAISKIIPINKGQFQPKKFLSVFRKPYGQKLLLQSLLSEAINNIGATCVWIFNRKNVNKQSYKFNPKSYFCPTFFGN